MLTIDKICFPLDTEVRQQLRTQRIIKIADGNPRLLKWLLEVIQQPGLAADELLTRLEKTEQKFRENILAQTLLDALELEEQKFLARLSVFYLPVTEEIIKVLTPQSATLEIPPTPLFKGGDFSASTSFLRGSPQAGGSDVSLVQRLTKLKSLSLVESATTHPTQPANYRVTTILESLLEPVLSESEWQATRQQAVRKIHQVWWEENKNSTEAQGLETVRLGLLAKEEEIAVTVGDRIANRWVNNSRFVEALELCQQLLAVYQDYRILGTIARAEEVLGFVQEAVTHYQQALELCPEEELQTKAATLHNMAGLKAQQGDIAIAIALWQQSLEICEQIGDVQGKAAILNNMAQVFAYQGDIPKVLALYEQSLEICEQIGDVKGKAVILNNMAQVFAYQGDIPKAIALWQQSLEIKEQIGDVKGKAATLNNMAQVFADQGDIPKAIALYEQSLEICEQIGDVKLKAITLNNMALEFAHQGDIPKAIALYEQSLEICEQIGNIQGKAATLNSMALQFAQQGDIPKAITLWQQNLEIFEQIGDVKGKAVTFSNMASLAGKTGDKARQSELNMQAISALTQVSAYADLLTVIGNLGIADESNSLAYLAQAVWLTLRIQAPLTKTVNLILALYSRVPQGDELEALLGATAILFCNYRGEGHPQFEEFQELSLKMISGAARIQGIETEEASHNWFIQQRLNDPKYFLPRLNQRLEEIVGDGWLFDRS